MARKITDHDLAPVLDAAKYWIDRCLIGDGSIFSVDQIWTLSNLADLADRLSRKSPDDKHTDYSRDRLNFFHW